MSRQGPNLGPSHQISFTSSLRLIFSLKIIIIITKQKCDPHQKQRQQEPPVIELSLVPAQMLHFVTRSTCCCGCCLGYENDMRVRIASNSERLHLSFSLTTTMIVLMMMKTRRLTHISLHETDLFSLSLSPSSSQRSFTHDMS